MTGSAKQSIAPLGERMDCFVASLPCANASRLSQAMTAGYSFAISRRIAPEVLHFVCPLRKQRAQGRPGARCTRGLACNCAQKTRTRAYRFSGNTPAFPAQWLYGLLRALPGERLFCHRRPCRSLLLNELDASTAASGPHDFAVRDRPHSSVAALASTASHRTFVTIAIAPHWVRRAELIPLICPTVKRNIFARRGGQTIGLICPSG